ncbi:hypothetical protein HQ524_02160 [Candidatus Uhrbacteria bacterium]|nr:hypothetical protein [Candidatus Uhrbacteria bacterium]
MKNQQGSLILEVLIAIGIASIFLVALLSMALNTSRTISTTSQRGEAQYSAYEGTSALETIAFQDLSVGMGQPVFASNEWSVSPGVETMVNDMTRSVTVSSIQRDAGCAIVESGGTVDPDSYGLSSTVEWFDAGGRLQALTSTTHRTRFDDPQGTCFAAQESGMVSVDVSTGEFIGSKQLRRLYVLNTGSQAVTIDKITFTWDNERTLNQIFMNTTKAWSDAGPGSPSGVQVSGTEIDIVDTVIEPAETFEINKIQFSADMSDVEMTLTLTFGDGSTYESGIFEPAD